MTLVGSKTIRLPEAVSNTYPFVPLHVDDYLPDEALEFGDLKIPSLASLVRIFVKPRLEIDGGIFPSDSSTRFIYAHVWRNRFFGTKLETIVAARIPALDLNCAELEIFVYDVYLKSFDALKRYARS